MLEADSRTHFKTHALSDEMQECIDFVYILHNISQPGLLPLTAGVADLSSSTSDAGEAADGFSFDHSLSEPWQTALTADRLRPL